MPFIDLTARQLEEGRRALHLLESFVKDPSPKPLQPQGSQWRAPPAGAAGPPPSTKQTRPQPPPPQQQNNPSWPGRGPPSFEPGTQHAAQERRQPLREINGAAPPPSKYQPSRGSVGGSSSEPSRVPPGPPPAPSRPHGSKAKEAAAKTRPIMSYFSGASAAAEPLAEPVRTHQAKRNDFAPASHAVPADASSSHQRQGPVMIAPMEASTRPGSASSSSTIDLTTEESSGTRSDALTGPPGPPPSAPSFEEQEESWKRELKGLNAEIDRRLMEEGDTAEDLRKRRTILEDGVRALISLRNLRSQLDAINSRLRKAIDEGQPADPSLQQQRDHLEIQIATEARKAKAAREAHGSSGPGRPTVPAPAPRPVPAYRPQPPPAPPQQYVPSLTPSSFVVPAPSRRAESSPSADAMAPRAFRPSEKDSMTPGMAFLGGHEAKPRDSGSYGDVLRGEGSMYGGSSSSGGRSDGYAGGGQSNESCQKCGQALSSFTCRNGANSGRQFLKCQPCDMWVRWEDDEGGAQSGGGGGGSSSYHQYESSSHSYSSSTYSSSTTAAGGETLDVRSTLDRLFGHREFRLGQEAVVQHAMAGKDVFVLMPTGGGKSLCYQLPAVCQPGLAVVFSPLISLIQDQVEGLRANSIEAVQMSSHQDYETEGRDIMNRLYHLTPHDGIKLLYITPEKLSRSESMVRTLQRLCERGLVSRFVIDEAHCISQWGHDFRPDYLSLRSIRQKFPGVPIMALTATANKRLVDDAVSLLGMKSPYIHRQSFNRSNLHYSVRAKSKTTLDEIAAIIQNNRKQSGIIYCLSRRDTMQVAEELSEKTGIRVGYYHGEMTAADRERVQRDWSSGKVAVIAATVAFGMGINKPDVRYVIHYALPKSLTHFYQESGRAGRDGFPAECIMYFSYKDMKVLANMIRKGTTEGPRVYSRDTQEKIRSGLDSLYKCVSFCVNEVDCRRALILAYFGEHFDRAECRATCDNCRNKLPVEHRDMTKTAVDVMRVLQSLGEQRVTLCQLMSVVHGDKPAFIKKRGLELVDHFGVGKDYSKAEIERLLQQMVLYGYLDEETCEIPGGQGFSAEYVREGPEASALWDGKKTVVLSFRDASSGGKKRRRKGPAAAASSSSQLNVSVDEAAFDAESEEEMSLGDPSEAASDPASKKPRAERRPRKERHVDETYRIDKKTEAEALYQVLLVWLNGVAEEQNTNYWAILAPNLLTMLAAIAPTTMEELELLPNIPAAKIEKYGSCILQTINQFLRDNNVKPKDIDIRTLKGIRTERIRTTKAVAGVNFEHFKAPNNDDRFGNNDNDKLLCQAAKEAEETGFAKSGGGAPSENAMVNSVQADDAGEFFYEDFYTDEYGN